ncbi:tetratricopeptide repeat protein [candidate division WWE3 bacterium]|uniref:Tetratricopeptide repeat protein n=1 Tax=candidate division WWE3 bacterium TaxID=2053526 RepID=A0A7X9HGQ3_UNCKA|nr:tetratricopeptide repeat protein [candidate division WWE3 bacterium]
MNSNNQNLYIVEKISKLIPILLSFLMPVFFLSITSEFFEFNKFALLLIGTLLLSVMWVIKLISGQKIELTKSSVDLSLIVLTIVMALSTIFSLNKSVSIYGSQGRWFPGLFPMLGFLFYYYLAAPVLKETKTLKMAFYALIAGSSVSTIVAILSYFNVYIGSADFMSIPNFTLVGSTTSALILAAVAMVGALAALAYEQNIPSKMLLVTSILLNFFYVALTGSMVGWAILAVGAVCLFVMIDFRGYSTNRSTSMILVGAMLAIVLLNVVPNTKNALKNPNMAAEITLPFNDSWIVATSTIRDYPLLATGPSTFYLNYSRYRPVSVNNTPVWNVRFDKPHDELLNSMATLGIVGLAAVLYFASRVAKFAWSAKNIQDESGLVRVISVSLLATLPVFLFTYATVINTFVLFQLLIMAIAAHAVTKEAAKGAELIEINFASIAAVTTIGEAGAIKREYFHYVAAAPMLLIAAYAGFLFYKSYAAEFYIRKSVIAAQSNNGSKIYEYQSKAINLNPRRDTYHVAYAQTNLALANALASKENLTDEDKTTIQTLIAQSIRSSRVATEVLNPLNVVNWQTRALIYRSILGVADNAAEWAIASYNTAIQLDPSNPALRLDIGGIYFAQQDYLSAANYFRQATSLKADYANAHYNFAQALIKLNDPANAKRELEITKTLVAQGSPDYQKVEQDLASLSQKPTVAGAQNTKPTVEQLTGQTTNGQTLPQEPLTKPVETQNNGTQNLNLQDLPQGSQVGATQPAQQ